MLLKVLVTQSEKDYALLDSGNGEKLERYGSVVLSRPDPQALWPKRLSEKEWEKADGKFLRDGKDTDWQLRKELPRAWQIEFGGLKFWIRPTAFKHTGLFPEQKSNWEWMRGVIARSLAAAGRRGNLAVLNLFGYTGGATLTAARAGASVAHVDGSKTAISWARDNAKLSGLEKKPIRWILDDAMKFVKREIKRGHKYHGIIMDPPDFGHGPGGELWKFEKHFLELLRICKQALADDPLFFLINAYASGYSSLMLENNLREMMKEYGGEVEAGEVGIQESGSERVLPCGVFGRWTVK